MEKRKRGSAKFRSF